MLTHVSTLKEVIVVEFQRDIPDKLNVFVYYKVTRNFWRAFIGEISEDLLNGLLNYR